MKLRHARLPAALVLLMLAAGCSGPQVRTLANGSGPAAYELRAASAAQLQAQAEQLCRGGYVVLRGAVRATAATTGAHDPDRAMIVAGQWLSGQPFDEAQATIVCAS